MVHRYTMSGVPSSAVSPYKYDPDWAPTGIPGPTIGARFGTVVTVGGTAETVEALLKDLLVISIEASRPAAPPD